MRFFDHSEAGGLLAQRLAQLAPEQPVILAIPPGGARLGWEIARRMKAPLDVLMVKEIAIPGRTGCALGSVVDGRFYPDDSACNRHGVPRGYAEILASSEEGEERQWEREVRHHRAPADLEGRTAIVVSDRALDRAGLGAVERALQERGVRAIIHAAPFMGAAPADLSVRCVGLYRPEEKDTAMLVNANFEQTTEDEIAELLDQSRQLTFAPWSLGGLHPDPNLVPAAEVDVTTY